MTAPGSPTPRPLTPAQRAVLEKMAAGYELVYSTGRVWRLLRGHDRIEANTVTVTHLQNKGLIHRWIKWGQGNYTYCLSKAGRAITDAALSPEPSDAL